MTTLSGFKECLEHEYKLIAGRDAALQGQVLLLQKYLLETVLTLQFFTISLIDSLTPGDKRLWIKLWPP